MRLLRGLSWVIVALIAAMTLWGAWLDLRWRHHWRDVQAMLARDGQTLDFRKTVPDPIPDAENFCAIPLLKDIALVIDDDVNKGEPAEKRARLETVRLPDLEHGESLAMAGASFGQRADLREWAAWLRKKASPSAPAESGDAARDLLSLFSKDDAVFVALAGGLDRPHGQWTPLWKTRDLPANLLSIPLPHYRCANGLTRSLALRGIAAVRAGDVSKAHESLRIVARIDEACLEEPTLIGFLVASAETADLANGVWELCDAQGGAAEDFRRLEAALAAMDFRRSIGRAMSSDLVANVSALRHATKAASKQQRFTPFHGHNPMHIGAFLDANLAELAEREFVSLIKPIRDRGWHAALVSARKLESDFAQLEKEQKAHPSGFVLTRSNLLMAKLVLPALPTTIYRAIYAQTLANEAMIACALERYRIEKGSYPESLDDVRLADGRALPMEVLTGKSMSYRKTANGKYALWSSGFDEKNHGGQRALDKKNPERTKFGKETYAGDWVWDFPDSPNPVVSR